jgi:cell division protein ZipA
VGDSFWDEPVAPVIPTEDAPVIDDAAEVLPAEPQTETLAEEVVVSEVVATLSDESEHEEAVRPPETPVAKRIEPKHLQREDQLSFVMDAPDDWELESFAAEARFESEEKTPADVSMVKETPVAVPKAKVDAQSKASNSQSKSKKSTKKAKPRFFDTIKELFASDDEANIENSQVDKPAPYSGPIEVLIFHVMAKRDSVLTGAELREALLANGLRLGDKSIFHRESQREGEPLFSCANAFNPGVFDLKTMDQMTTQGISLFMQMPNGEDAMYAFEEMAIAAGNIAARLGADLQDDTRSVMTKQTLEHYRQKVIDFERRRKMRVL